MGITIGGNGDAVKALLGGMNTSSPTGGLESLLGEMNSIQSGSYKGLVKQYYKNVEKAEKEDVDETEKKTNAATSTSASNLSKAADKLLDKGANSVFNKEKVTDENGKTTEKFNADKIYSAVSDFVDSYNSMIKSGQKSNETSVLTYTAGMATLSNTLNRSLSAVGISISSSGKLSVDEDTFKSADMNKVKSLFNDTGSFAYQIKGKANSIENRSNEALGVNYSASGVRNLGTSELISNYNTTT